MRLTILLSAVLGFAVGIGCGTTFQVPSEVVLVLLVVSVALGVVERRTDKYSPSLYLRCLGVVSFGLAIGIFRAELAVLPPSLLTDSVGQAVEFLGVVAREPDVRAAQQLLYVRLDDGELVLVSTDRLAAVAYGDVVKVAGTLRVPTTFTTEFGRTFDYPGYLRARGVRFTISFATVTVHETGHGQSLIAALLATKHTFTTALERVLPEPQVGLGEGLLLGEKRALGDKISEQFRRTGLTHIVVLSGYNVMLVVAFCLYVFAFFLGLRGRVVAGLIAITLFAVIVGPSATVVRASLMAGLVLLAQVLGRRYDVLRVLLLAGTVMLVCNPYLLLFDIGFQLSFMATLGLVLFAPQFESTVASRGLVSLKEFFIATLVTQIAVLPLLVYHIGQVSIISLVANILVLPVVPAAMLATFAAGTVALVATTVAVPLSAVAQLTLLYILTITAWLSALPFAAVTTPEISPCLVLLWYVTYGVGWYYMRHKRSSRHETEGDEQAPMARQASLAAPLAQSAEKPDDLPVLFR